MSKHKISFTDERSNFGINIDLDGTALSGGVYMFLIDSIPLYIGETNNFMKRLSEHLYKLKDDLGYFGIDMLKGKHMITYTIIRDGMGFEADKDDRIKRNLKRTPDKNLKDRVSCQNYYIERYKPLTQNPISYSKEELVKIRTRRKDSMINDKHKSNIVKEGINNIQYSDILEFIKEELN